MNNRRLDGMTELKLLIPIKTLERAEFIQNVLKKENSAQAIAVSVKLTEALVREIMAGNKILVEGTDKKLHELKVEGLNG